MNDFTNRAISALTEADTAISTILTEFCGQYKTEEFSEVNEMYHMAVNLRVLKSRYADAASPVIREGDLTVHNESAMIEIDGVQLIGDIQFEIFMDNKWIKGHRMNSSMGRAFISKEGSFILYDGIKGRVSLPLVIDNSLAENSVCSPVGNACSPVSSTCSPTGNTCSPVSSTCSPTGNTCSPVNSTCSPIGNTCSPVSNTCPPVNSTCSPAGNTCSPVNSTCSPIGNICSPVNSTCSPIGNTCSPVSNTCSSLNSTCSPADNACSPIGSWTVF